MQSHTKNYLRSLLENLQNRSDRSATHLNFINKLEELCNDTSIPWPQKNTLWNNYTTEHFDDIPQKYPLPMVIQMTDQPYVPQYPKGLEKVRVSPDILDNHMKTRRAIAGVCATFGVQHMQRAAVATEGAISFDILSRKEELD